MMTYPTKKYFLETFSDELRCSICHEFLRDPMLTKECLHRFCARCIQREVAAGLRHCPECRLLLPNKVPFKSDPNFASILNKLTAQRKTFTQRDAAETMRQHDVARRSSLGSAVESPLLDKSVDGPSSLTAEEKDARMSESSLPRPAEPDCPASKSQESRCQPTTLQSWAEKQRLNRENNTPLILWPDASVFRDDDLPGSLRHPRYIYVPAETTVAHLAEYLLLRCELESNWTKRDEYSVEFTCVDDEREEFTLLIREASKADHLNAAAAANVGGDYILKLRNNSEMPTVMFSVEHPFRAVAPTVRVPELLSPATTERGNLSQRAAGDRNCHSQSHHQRSPPKVVFRFTRK